MGVLLSLHAPSGTMRLACNLAGLVPQGGLTVRNNNVCECFVRAVVDKSRWEAMAYNISPHHIAIVRLCFSLLTYTALLLSFCCPSPPPSRTLRRQAYPQDLLGGGTPAAAAVRRRRHQHRRGAAGARRRAGPAAGRTAAAAHADAGTGHRVGCAEVPCLHEGGNAPFLHIILASDACVG